jgi:spermidine/putrescine transport system permease protein
MKRFKEAFFADAPFFLSIPAVAWQALFLWIPLFFMMCASFYVAGTGLTLKFYGQVVNIVHIRIILRSLFFACANSILCVAFAYPVAYFLVFKARKTKEIWVFFLMLPFFVNFLLHVYSWFFMLERNGILNTILSSLGIINEPLRLVNTTFAIMIVLFHAYLPFMVLPIYMVFEKLNYSLIEASHDLGATPTQTFSRITLPLTLSGARTGFFLVFILSFGEYVIPTLLGGGKTLFVGPMISHYFLISHNIGAGGAFTVLSALFLCWALVSVYIVFEYILYKITR